MVYHPGNLQCDFLMVVYHELHNAPFPSGHISHTLGSAWLYGPSIRVHAPQPRPSAEPTPALSLTQSWWPPACHPVYRLGQWTQTWRVASRTLTSLAGTRFLYCSRGKIQFVFFLCKDVPGCLDLLLLSILTEKASSPNPWRISLPPSEMQCLTKSSYMPAPSNSSCMLSMVLM